FPFLFRVFSRSPWSPGQCDANALTRRNSGERTRNRHHELFSFQSIAARRRNEHARRVRSPEFLFRYFPFKASRTFQSARSSRDRALLRSHPASCATRRTARSRSFLFVG